MYSCSARPSATETLKWMGWYMLQLLRPAEICNYLCQVRILHQDLKLGNLTMDVLGRIFAIDFQMMALGQECSTKT